MSTRRIRHLASTGALALVATGLAATGTVTGGIPPAAAAAGDITTIAGSVAPGPSPAAATGMAPVALTRIGTAVYIGDAGNCTVRRFDTVTGTQTVVAGTGLCGYRGDGGPATAADIGLPNGLAADGAGNLFVASNHTVRRIAAGTGIITTVAGTGTAGFSGDGGPATAAQLNLPRGVAVDGAGNVYIADSTNNRVRRVAAGSGTITTIAGGGASLAEGVPATTASVQPWGLTMSPAGGLVIAEGGAHVVRTVDLTNGTITSTAGNRVQASGGDGGPATAASINGPVAVSFDSGGNLLVADYASPSSVVRRVDTVGTITTVAGLGPSGFAGDGGPATAALLRNPIAVVAAGPGTFWIADAFNYRVRAVTAGTIATVAGTGTISSGVGGPATAAQLRSPSSVAVDGSGNTYVGDDVDRVVYRIDEGTGEISVVAGGGSSTASGIPATDAALGGPSDVAVQGESLYVTDEGTNRIVAVDLDTGTLTIVAGGGASLADGVPATSASLDRPTGLSFAPDGDVVFSDKRNHVIRRIDSGTQTIATIVGGGSSGPGDGGPATAAQLAYPGHTAYDSAGNLYFTDWTQDDDGRVRRVDAATNVITTISGRGTNVDGDNLPAADAFLLYPGGIAVDGAGNVYVAEGGRARVRRIDPNGIITTVAGGGPGSGFGDGGPARWARFNSPGDLRFDADGNLLVADGNGRRVRRVAAPFPSGAARFHRVTPFRLLDSRNATGGWNGVPLGAGQSRALQVGGQGGIPTSAGALVANVTVTGGTAASYLSAFPTGSAPPTVANLLFGAGQTVPNHVTTAIGANGQVSFFNQLGSVHVVVDVLGWYDDGSGPGDGFTAITPTRVLDTRVANAGGPDPIGPGAVRKFAVDIDVGSASKDTVTIVGNLTVTGGTAASYLQARPAGASPTVTANLLFAKGQTVPNLVTVPLGPGGEIELFNQLGSVHAILDVVGYYAPGSGDVFRPITPTRVLDSRSPLSQWGAYVLGQAETKDLVARGSGVPGALLPTTATALVSNVTVTGGNQASYLQAFPAGATQPVTANLLFAKGQTVPNAVTTALGTGGALSLFNQKGQVFVIVDAGGYFNPS